MRHISHPSLSSPSTASGSAEIPKAFFPRRAARRGGACCNRADAPRVSSLLFSRPSAWPRCTCGALRASGTLCGLRISSSGAVHLLGNPSYDVAEVSSETELVLLSRVSVRSCENPRDFRNVCRHSRRAERTLTAAAGPSPCDPYRQTLTMRPSLKARPLVS